MNSARADARLGRMKLPARYGGIITPFIISVFMSCVVSGVATAKSIGLASGFVSLWMSAWAASWLVAFPTLLVVVPVVRRITAVLVHPPER